MKINEIINEEWFAWIAPDGSVQPSTLSLDIETVIAVTKILHKAGIGQSFNELHRKGFTIQKVKLTIKLA